MARKVSPDSAALYSVHPSIAYARAIIDNLPEKTGKSIDEWVTLLGKAGPADIKERREWLKKQHGLGGTTAWMIADWAAGKQAEDVDPVAYLKAAPGYVEQMYAGPKAGLRPLHDALVGLGKSLGADVKICPCQTIVPFYREHVFAQVKPTTRTRIDFGLALKGFTGKLPARLKDTGGLKKGDRITHCFPLTSIEEIDDEVKLWLRKAYELDGAG
jgi:hypothetical protein